MADEKKESSEDAELDQDKIDSTDDVAAEADFLDRMKYKVKTQGWFADLKICIGVLTRLPVEVNMTSGDYSIANATRLFPLVGALVGVIGAFVLSIAGVFDFSSAILALLALLAMTLVTGALHEDGLADTFDGLGGGMTREQKLEIMRDSQIGSYGVMALLFSFGLRWAALTEITDEGISMAVFALIATAAASRAALPAIMHYIPHAREDGLSVGAGKPSFDRAMVALLIGAAFLLFLLGFRVSILSIGLSVLAAGIFVYFVATRIGGQTGDVLGATQQIVETVTLLTIAMVVAE